VKSKSLTTGRNKSNLLALTPTAYYPKTDFKNMKLEENKTHTVLTLSISHENKMRVVIGIVTFTYGAFIAWWLML
jgi:hypothetical protein